MSTCYAHTAQLRFDFVTPECRLYLGDTYDQALRKEGRQGRYLTVKVEGGSREECERILQETIAALVDELSLWNAAAEPRP